MKIVKVKQFATWLLEKLRRKVPPAKPDPMAEKANRVAEKTCSYSSDTENENVFILNNHTIWPHTENREDIDRIYTKLTHFVPQGFLRPVGGEEGSATPLRYWYGALLPGTCDEIRKVLEPEEVSETRKLSG